MLRVHETKSSSLRHTCCMSLIDCLNHAKIDKIRANSKDMQLNDVGIHMYMIIKYMVYLLCPLLSASEASELSESVSVFESTKP